MEGASRNSRIVAIAALGLSCWASGCVGPVGTTAASMLRKVRESPDPNLRHMAYAKLASPRAYESEAQKAEAAQVLSERLAKGEEPVASRVVICNTLGELRRPEARGVLLRAVSEPEPAVRAAACRALGKVGQPIDATILAKIMATDSLKDCQIAAIEGLAALKAPDPRVDEMLVDGMENPDPAIRLASLDAIRAISGQDLGLDPGPWREYAEQRTKAVAAQAPKVESEAVERR